MVGCIWKSTHSLGSGDPHQLTYCEDPKTAYQRRGQQTREVSTGAQSEHGVSEQVEHHAKTEKPKRADCDNAPCAHGEKGDCPDCKPHYVEPHEGVFGKRLEAKDLRKPDGKVRSQLLEEMEALNQNRKPHDD